MSEAPVKNPLTPEFIGYVRSFNTDAADAIEALENGIAELERVNKNLREKINQHHDRYWEDRWRTEKANNQSLEKRVETQEKRISDCDEARDWLIERNRTLDARITELEAENTKLREALRPFAVAAKDIAEDDGSMFGNTCNPVMARKDYFAARAALGDSDDN